MNTAETSSNESETPSNQGTNGNGHKLRFDILKEAKDQGIAKSFREIALKLRLSPTTLSNIVHGRSGGSERTKHKIERLFGKPLEKLGDGTPPVKTRAKPGPKPGSSRKQPVQAQAQPATAEIAVDAQITIEDAYRIASLFNPALKEAAKATLQKALNEISSGS